MLWECEWAAAVIGIAGETELGEGGAAAAVGLAVDVRHSSAPHNLFCGSTDPGSSDADTADLSLVQLAGEALLLPLLLLLLWLLVWWWAKKEAELESSEEKDNDEALAVIVGADGTLAVSFSAATFVDE